MVVKAIICTKPFSAEACDVPEEHLRNCAIRI